MSVNYCASWQLPFRQVGAGCVQPWKNCRTGRCVAGIGIAIGAGAGASSSRHGAGESSPPSFTHRLPTGAASVGTWVDTVGTGAAVGAGAVAVTGVTDRVNAPMPTAFSLAFASAVRSASLRVIGFTGGGGGGVAVPITLTAFGFPNPRVVVRVGYVSHDSVTAFRNALQRSAFAGMFKPT